MPPRSALLGVRLISSMTVSIIDFGEYLLRVDDIGQEYKRYLMKLPP